MLGLHIVTLTSARLKAPMWFPSLRGINHREGTCKRCDSGVFLKTIVMEIDTMEKSMMERGSRGMRCNHVIKRILAKHF